MQGWITNKKIVDNFANACITVLSKITDSEIKKQTIKTLVLIAWFDLLGKVKIMPKNEFDILSEMVLNYLKVLDKTLNISLIRKTFYPEYTNIYNL